MRVEREGEGRRTAWGKEKGGRKGSEVRMI